MSTTDTDATELDIAQLARRTGLTSRTLRHYDAIGLLTPAWTGDDGRRHYGGREIARLQHILVLRELDVPLSRIGAIVDAAPDDAALAAHLTDHLAGLEAERDRYATLAATVRRTVAALKEGRPMTADDMLDGFDRTPYEPEARERWGDAAVDTSNARWDALGKDGQQRHLAAHQEVVEALGAAKRIGLSAGSPEVQEVVAKHYAWVSLFWTPDAETYCGLTQMYVDDERFRRNYDEVAPGAAVLLRDAAAIYAERELS